MQTVLYADLLFLINFGMDLISLWLTFMIVHQRVSALRIFISAVIGGIYGVVSVVIALNGFLSLLMSVAVSALMIAAASKGRPTVVKCIKYTFILWGIGALIGGIVSAVCSLGNRNPYSFRAHNAPFFILALSSAICTVVVRAISSVRHIRECEAEISSFGTTVRISALVDSGNLVREPISGRPVIFIRKGVFFRAAPKDVTYLCSDVSAIDNLSPDLRRRTRIVCAERVGGSSAMLCFFPDDVTVINRKYRKSASVAVAVENVADYNGYDAVVPSSLFD